MCQERRFLSNGRGGAGTTLTERPNSPKFWQRVNQPAGEPDCGAKPCHLAHLLDHLVHLSDRLSHAEKSLRHGHGERLAATGLPIHSNARDIDRLEDLALRDLPDGKEALGIARG